MPTVQLYVSHQEMKSFYEAATAAGYETPNEWIIDVLKKVIKDGPHK